MSSQSTAAVTNDQSEETILEVRDASVTFDMDRGSSRVLDDVNIDVHRHEILGVVGESGSGKSMFASAMLDAVVKPGHLTGEIIYQPEEGESVDILGLTNEELKNIRWEEISMVFQGAMSSFNPTQNIKAHFVETLEDHNKDVDEGMEHARELLEELYLDPDRVFRSYPHELSGGMKQRALIALSLLLKPNIVVMDEPTAALDLLMQRSILDLISNLQERYDLTVVFITHDLPLVAGLADRLAVMYAFQFVEIGQARNIIENSAHPYTRELLQAVPNLQTSLTEMQPIEGESPDPVNVPSGCSYHPRCPIGDEFCRENDPHLYEVENNHRSACHYWEDAREQIAGVDLSEADAIPKVDYEMSGEPVVSLRDVSVHFDQSSNILERILGDVETVRAVDDIDLNIYENDVIALVGESGCGKTTLGKTIIGVERPSEGSVRYRGQDIWEARDNGDDVDIPYSEIRRSLQIIHQDPGSSLNPNRTVITSLSMPLKRWMSELAAEDRHARILAMLEEVGMTPASDYAHRFPHQLSGGEKQRVALIRAMLMNPDVILADEAVSALDVSLRVEMMDLMLELQDMFNTSYVFISHDLANARYLAEKSGGRIGVMYLGEIVEIGTPDQIINNPKHPYTKILKWSTADLEMEDSGEPPMREIDIPDPVDPPSGCRFHTRCPEAREVCTSEHPTPTDDETGHAAACFRDYPEDHPYWESESIVDE